MKILQSRNWWIDKDINWIIENADFMFLDKGDNRPYIVTKNKLPSSVNSNCFKFDNDKYGILINAHFKYDDHRSRYFAKTTDLVKENFPLWIQDWCGKDFFSPSEFKVLISNLFNKQKDIIIEI